MILWPQPPESAAHGVVLPAGLDFENRCEIPHLNIGRWRVRAEVPIRIEQL